MLRRSVLLATAALLALPAVGFAQDFAGTALNIIPSGEYGSVPVPAGADTQAKMYDALTPLFNNVTQADLMQDFKSENFGAGAGSPAPTHVESTPWPGVSLVRDSFNVPHITGVTHDDVVRAAGWVVQEDRGLLLGQARAPARFAALDAPGIDAFSLVTGLKTVTVSPQADAIINREQTAALMRQGAEGQALLHDIDVYVQGVNARLIAEGSSQKPWTRVDVYSINALAGQIFGQGGGDEVHRSMFLSSLQQRLGKNRAMTVFNDLSQHLSGDTPYSIPGNFPYEPIPRRASGNAVISNGSETTASAAGFAARAHKSASNFQLISAKRSSTGHPIFVGGPQIGYYYPGLTLEMDLHGPGIDARGAAQPGGPGDILIGRGPDFAWSLTSAGSDTNDEFVETLCGGSSTKYMYKGRCRSMGRIDAGNIKGKGEVRYLTTVHGPVEGYARTGGKRVAISFQRSSHGEDVLWQIMFRRLSNGQVKDPQSFFAAAATSPFTFNVGYADDKHIAMYSAGKLPIRDPRVDPRLPTIGTGQFEWRGFLGANGHPHAVDPPSGVIVNWNNKPAAGFGSSDSQYGYGSIHRMQMIAAGIAQRQVNTPANVVSAMNAAATMDLPVQGSMFPALDKILKSGPAPSARDAQMLTLLENWRANPQLPSSRLDLNLTGTMTDGPGPAIMDAAYPQLAQAVLQPLLGTGAFRQLVGFEGASNEAKHGFENGMISYLDKDLRQLTGTRFRTPFATRFCGGGNLAKCRAALWSAMDSAGNQIAATQGSDPTKWTASSTAERITFAPGLLTTTIRYTNRPSGIQQILSFTGHR